MSIVAGIQSRILAAKMIFVRKSLHLNWSDYKTNVEVIN